MSRVRVVAAPNPFKGSLGAPEAAAAIARGVRRAIPDADVVEVPIADGGEGTVSALVAARGGELARVRVTGPLGEPVDAVYGVIDGGRTAVVELASSSGLPLVPIKSRDPRVTSTYGFGQLLEAARSGGAESLIVGIGGSATNDGGAGMAQAVGFRLLDGSGRDLARGGAALARLARIEAPVANPWPSVEVKVAVDVTNPLCGPEGASAVYGPQKGATPEIVDQLDAALENLAAIVERDLGIAVRDLPGAGAAGGAGAGLVAFLGADLVRGAPLVADAAGLDRAVAGADLVFTGEGQVDRQTRFGKGPAEVARRAAAAGVPCFGIAGRLGDGWRELIDEGLTSAFALAEGPATEEELQGDAARLVEAAAERATRAWMAGR